MFRKAMNDRQKEEMTQVNLAQMNEKRMREDLNRRHERAEQGTSPAHIGNGYRQQLAFMQEAERLNNISLKNYQQRIANQATEKTVHQKILERQAEEEAMARMNAAAYNVQDYKNRLMEEHNTLLKNQLENQIRTKKALTDAQAREDAMLAQRHASVNSLLNARE